jgi:hypothetical protein
MTAELKQLALSASENDCTQMLNELLSFGSEELSDSTMNGIISRVTGKAEQEMNDTKTKPKKRIKRRIISFIIAAAVLLPVGAYAAGRLFHKENVEWYLKGSERIEQNESAVKNYVMENKDFKITIDSQLSDGHNVMMIRTNEAKNSKAKEMLKNEMGLSGVLYTKAQYADGSDGPNVNNTQAGAMCTGGYAFGEHASSGDAEVVILSCKGIDLKKDIKLTYCQAKGDVEGVEIGDEDNYEEPYLEELEGFEFTTNFSPNVKSVELKSADGKKLVLSEFEIYSPDGMRIGDNIEFREVSKHVSFIKSNGEKYQISEDNKTDANYDYIIFGEIIDPDEFKGVEINGVQYLK